ncbi:MAG: magnesium/cobalt transporter CorA [Bacteroidia bacterium]|nr:magnesium/cobalt transporter CorA [Bacteroidia bacterium]MBP7260482.1 magnesium/cobalt transporter CorA [Bacteroidia bacterium]MBP9179276.1 magnesium/cobalt transporter CorA [Bacteroidia bacterium]MBP9724053.1 magnesium/cobalt transporter CorA [Bacteroidia bacterium]
MITIYYRENDRLVKGTGTQSLADIDYNKLVWVDLNNLTAEEEVFIETRFHINIPDDKQMMEIESSSRYYESERIIIANSNFLVPVSGTYRPEPASFILKNNYLITYRNYDLRSFNEMFKRLETHAKNYSNGYQILVTIFEIRIDLDADLIESIANDITQTGKLVSDEKLVSKDIIFKISYFQEMNMLLRQNIIDKQRVMQSLLRSEFFPEEYSPRVRSILKDISSLIDHTDFGFERLEYLQETFLGLINLEQNKIIKIFTVVSVIFMPPTLIASIYGMNFTHMPEIGWNYGYLFAVALMVLSSIITLLVFKKNKWL